MSALPLFFLQKNDGHNKSRNRRAVSPIIATTIILAITVVLGLSLWSFANSGVNSATKTYADTVNEFGKFTSDRFVIASVTFDPPPFPANDDDLTVWVYNAGKTDTTIQAVIVSCKQCATPMGPITLTIADEKDATPDMTIGPKSLEDLNFESSDVGAVFTTGDTYQVQVISETGAYQSIFQKEE